jgi:hypothetical protein
MVRLAIDFENPCREWWEYGGQELWDGLLEGFEENDVVLDESVAQSVLVRAAAIPGWDDGPEYAPHPLIVKPVDEDEDV